MYVYVLTQIGGENLTKIGFTKNLKQRISSIQNGSPYNLNTTLLIKSSDYKQIEKDLHRHFKNKGNHIAREWFYIDSEDISYIKDKYNSFIIQHNKPLLQPSINDQIIKLRQEKNKSSLEFIKHISKLTKQNTELQESIDKIKKASFSKELQYIKQNWILKQQLKHLEKHGKQNEFVE